VVLAGLVFVVHPFGYLTRHPYWVDEVWVALLAKAPLSRYVTLSSSTPVGWLLLVRFAPFGRDRLRLVPLLFASGDVVMAYVVARALPWKSTTAARFAGTVAAVLVLLAPISLVRHDLKQYTADAFFALLIVWLASRVEAEPSRRRLTHLSVAAVVAVPFSTVSMFVSAAVFLGLLIAQLGPSSRRHVGDMAIAAGGTAVVLGLYLAFVIDPHDNRALREYWQPYYLTGGPFHEIGQAWHRLAQVSSALGAPGWALVVLLGLGVFFMTRLQRPAIALAVLLLWIEMFLAGVLGKYPFLDQRTSHFLLVFSLTVIGVGIAGVVVTVASRSRLVAVVVTVAMAVGFWHGAVPYVRTRSIPDEDVRSQVLYVVAHRRPNDLVVVSLMSSYGLGFYWPGAKSTFSVDKTGNNTNGYTTRVANVPGLVYANGRAAPDTLDVMRSALALAKERGGDPRIWIIRTHLHLGEGSAWDSTFRTLRLHPELLPVGAEPLAVIDGEKQ